MARTNIDKATEAHVNLPILRAQRDRFIWRAWREDGMSQSVLAARLGVTRQAVQQACQRGAPPADAEQPPSAPSTRASSATEVTPRFRP